MAKSSYLTFLIYTLLVAFSFLSNPCHGTERMVHVVFMGDYMEGVELPSHQTMLEQVVGRNATMIYSYKNFNGFAANLTDKEVAKFIEMDEVVSVLPNTNLKLQTTRSWEFVGFTQNTFRYPAEGNVIVGLLDTGIWPESESFKDDGFGPPPSKWKGTCQTAKNFTCNNKIIGAKYYTSNSTFDPHDIESPRDSNGHGTHTASIVAGQPISGTSYFGLAKGVAQGGTPSARLAVYKVCWKSGCWSADILAAFDDAISDGVDIISVPLAGTDQFKYMDDPIAIGSYYAMKHGILTSNAAGNNGPSARKVANYAPWSLTVASSSIDRKFMSRVVLGNGESFVGDAINSFTLYSLEVPLIYAGDAPNVSAGMSNYVSEICSAGSLNSEKVSGKIVLCDMEYYPSGVQFSNGSGAILRYWDQDGYSAVNYPLPATVLNNEDYAKVKNYVRSTRNSFGTLVGETVKDVMSPMVDIYSSRGPNPITPDILKPDLTAPGVNILASWSPLASPTVGFNEDKRRVDFTFNSGTSVSCSHVSGAAAYVKSVHPTWSPAAIKSALMTSAMIMDPRKNKFHDAEFSYGSGHINPLKAIDPGLVFDASDKDYINFLCSQGYNTSTVRRVSGDKASTCDSPNVGQVRDLNYPSFALAIPDGQYVMGSFYRTVTNVGTPNSTYIAKIFTPSSLNIIVTPSTLSFASVGEKKSFVVKVSGGIVFQQPIISASVVLTDGRYSVRSPLVVYTILPQA